MPKTIEIKGWHVSQKRMFSAYEMTRDQLTLLPTGQFINVSSTHTSLSQIFSADEFIPLEFTGLRDKVGKKAYHKDIVRMDIFVYTVEWCEKSARFYLKSINPADTFKYTMAHISKNGDVIGSFYENPEYLNPEVENKLGAQ